MNPPLSRIKELVTVGMAVNDSGGVDGHAQDTRLAGESPYTPGLTTTEISQSRYRARPAVTFFGSAPAFGPKDVAASGHAPEPPDDAVLAVRMETHGGGQRKTGESPDHRSSFIETFRICRSCRHQFAPHLMRCPECNTPSPEIGE